jgi:GNAT superfamily N-acetyltransferase
MIAFRDAVPADADALARLGAQTFTETFGHLYRPQDLAAFLRHHTPQGWAAELTDPAYRIRIGEVVEDGRPRAVAYAKLGPPKLPFEPRGPSAELRQLYVLGPWHGSGAGQLLMDWAIATARADGAQDLYLSVFVDNHRARRFYLRQGFERVGTYTFMVGDQADEDDLMRLTL